jgi:hypothetical protein
VKRTQHNGRGARESNLANSEQYLNKTNEIWIFRFSERSRVHRFALFGRAEQKLGQVRAGASQDSGECRQAREFQNTAYDLREFSRTDWELDIQRAVGGNSSKPQFRREFVERAGCRANDTRGTVVSACF